MMALKWKKEEYGGHITARNWSIKPDGKDYVLRLGSNFICILKTQEGCKRVASCINREMAK